MKKITLLIVVFLFIGCVSSANRIPDGKSYENDWERDEAFCLNQSRYITGFFAANPVSALWNIDASKRYNQCLRDLGWLK